MLITQLLKIFIVNCLLDLVLRVATKAKLGYLLIEAKVRRPQLVLGWLNLQEKLGA